LIDRHRSDVKATGTNWHGVHSWWLRFVIFDTLITGCSLILDHSDVSRAGHWLDVWIGRLGQLFELPFLSPSSERAAP
jgi:hypothetical protein